MTTSSFKRIEKKYILNTTQRSLMLSNICQYMVPDKYKTSAVHSIYLDNSMRSIISRSIEKPMYKEKLRIRSYDILDEKNPVFLELKTKYKGVVYKRRIKMTYGAAKMFIAGKSYSEAITKYPLNSNSAGLGVSHKNDTQIASEINAFLERHDYPKESMLISFVRSAYVAKDNDSTSANKQLRITFDSNLKYCDIAAGCSKENEDEYMPIIPSKTTIMEIKCIGGYPL